MLHGDYSLLSFFSLPVVRTEFCLCLLALIFQKTYHAKGLKGWAIGSNSGSDSFKNSDPKAQKMCFKSIVYVFG